MRAGFLTVQTQERHSIPCRIQAVTWPGVSRIIHIHLPSDAWESFQAVIHHASSLRSFLVALSTPPKLACIYYFMQGRLSIYFHYPAPAICLIADGLHTLWFYYLTQENSIHYGWLPSIKLSYLVRGGLDIPKLSDPSFQHFILTLTIRQLIGLVLPKAWSSSLYPEFPWRGTGESIYERFIPHERKRISIYHFRMNPFIYIFWHISIFISTFGLCYHSSRLRRS